MASRAQKLVATVLFVGCLIAIIGVGGGGSSEISLEPSPTARAARSTSAQGTVVPKESESHDAPTQVAATESQRGDDVAVPGATIDKDLLFDLETALGQAVSDCNKDGRNNAGHKEVSCILCRNAIITVEKVWCDLSVSSEAKISLHHSTEYPPTEKAGRGTRHHLRTMPIDFKTPPSDVLSKTVDAPTPVGYYQSPVSGAQYLNVWHTLADFGNMAYHTIGSLLTFAKEKGMDRKLLTWVSRTPFHQMHRGCFDFKSCTSLPLFDLIQRLLGGTFRLLGSEQAPLRFKFLLIGLNTRCSPIPTEDVGIPMCHTNLKNVRNALLESYGLPTERVVTKEEAWCPTVHVMSRQTDRYRRITPFEEMVKALRKLYSDTLQCSSDRIRVISLSTSIPMREQIESVANSTILLAGRGGGTTLSMFLAKGGGYLSISGDDRWNPFRDLVPEWVTLEHYRAKVVHHENPDRPPQKFGAGKSAYTDPNRAGYKVVPSDVASSLEKLVKKLQFSH